MTKRPKLPETVLLEVAPWTLKWSMDSRYGVFAHLLEQYKEVLGLKVISFRETFVYFYRKLQNLFNYQYTRTSVKYLLQGNLPVLWPQKFQPSQHTYDLLAGDKDQLMLKDGSCLYDATYIRDHKTSSSYNHDGNFKLEGDYYSESAIAAFIRNIDYLRRHNIKVKIVLTPYHHSVLRSENPYARYLREVELKVTELAKTHQLEVLGSFDPYRVGCQMDEFFDAMHPMKSCIGWITGLQSS